MATLSNLLSHGDAALFADTQQRQEHFFVRNAFAVKTISMFTVHSGSAEHTELAMVLEALDMRLNDSPSDQAAVFTGVNMYACNSSMSSLQFI